LTKELLLLCQAVSIIGFSLPRGAFFVVISGMGNLFLDEEDPLMAGFSIR